MDTILIVSRISKIIQKFTWTQSDMKTKNNLQSTQKASGVKLQNILTYFIEEQNLFWGLDKIMRVFLQNYPWTKPWESHSVDKQKSLCCIIIIGKVKIGIFVVLLYQFLCIWLIPFVNLEIQYPTRQLFYWWQFSLSSFSV